MSTLLNPAILFFVFGIFAGLVKSNLEIPHPISKFLSLYLLMSLGLKGGWALSASGFTTDVLVIIGIAMILSMFIPLLAFWLLKRMLGGFDAAGIAATYGSISAVTFVTASTILSNSGITTGGFMASAMALMESPAIIIGVFLSSQLRNKGRIKLRNIFKDSFTEGANLLLLASLAVGFITGEKGKIVLNPFTGDLFIGMLAFFLLDMGLQVSKNLPLLKGKHPIVLAYAVIAPMIHSLIALGLCYLGNVELGNTILLMVLAASASYIAVPAAIRQAIPEANPGLYLGLSLGITFPFNILCGIPIYIYLAKVFL